MVMSIQALASAASLLETTILVDSVYLCTVGEPVTVGFDVSRPVTRLTTGPIQALVQTTVLQNAAESSVSNLYSVKVAQGTVFTAGMAVEVVTCTQEPDLVGKLLLIDKVSQNGLSLIRKGVASDFHTVDQQGKEAL